ncbi:sulfur carrier protein ThiS [Paenibacillus macerans]|uniref:sulfur carrier protein ThiS n=1 Tax=Paenibacillus macerans TaxID=44252 RepID=UPI00203FD4C4|nr:sulfur carrier protein ThiS [Paenibacillus macerans]MCM3702104.1 sulfur carrier protein ThiS [Paenibacillus macerans]
MLQIHLNGRDTLLKEDCVTVDDLLADSPWNKERILVELNGTVVRKEAYTSTRLAEGDHIELVHFVGGG